MHRTSIWVTPSTGLEVRRQDFDNAFSELVDRTIELKPDFMIIAGDLFHQATPLQPYPGKYDSEF